MGRLAVSRRTGCTIESLEGRQLLSSTIDSELAAVAATNSFAAAHPVTRAIAAAPALTIGNPDFLPFSDRLIFNKIQKNNPTYGDVVHDTNDLLLTNSGSAPLIISSIKFSASAPWMLSNPPKFPLTIAAGKFVNLQVKFIAASVPPHTNNQTNDVKPTNLVSVQKAGGVWDGSLTINSNAAGAPAKVVALAGYYQLQSEHENEPGLQTIINLLGGWTTNLGPQQPDFKEAGTRVDYGEEVANSAFWTAADPTKGVLVRDLAAFHNQGNASSISWYTKGASLKNAHRIFKSAQLEGQSLLPHLYSATNGAEPYAYGTFKPGTAPFALDLDGESTDDSVNLMGPTKGAGHHVRAWPVRDQNGNIEPNNYFFGVDYSNTQYENYDFQDNVYYVENVKPLGT